jgi:MFS family permease
MFMLGAFIFAVGSFIASISNNVGTMIAGESVIEGIGAALMMPATASLLVSTYKGRDRAIAMGMWGGIAAASSAIGPILGGYLATNYSWRWGFRINIFVVALLLIGSFIIKESRDKEEKPSLDVVGILLSSIGLLSLVYGIIQSSSYGWLKAKEVSTLFGYTLNLGDYSVVPIALAIGLFLLIAFIFWELKVAKTDQTPLVSMSIFKNSQFNSGIAVTSIMALGQAGLIFSFPIFFQAVRGLDAYHTGLAFLPMSLTALVMAPFAAFFGQKIAPKRLIQFGLLLSIIAMYILRRTFNVDATQHDFVLV